jgi:hypothetical protein
LVIGGTLLIVHLINAMLATEFEPARLRLGEPHSGVAC